MLEQQVIRGAQRISRRAGELLVGTALCLLGAAIGVAIWSLIAYKTGYTIGWIAWGLGALAGLGMYVGHRDFSPLAGLIAAGVSLVGVFAAKLIVFWLVVYGVVTGHSSNSDVRRAALAFRMAAESLFQEGIEPNDPQWEQLWDGAFADAERSVKSLSDEDVQTRLDEYLEAERAYAQEMAAANPEAAAQPVSASEVVTAVAAESGTGSFLGFFFTSMFRLRDLLFIFLAVASAYRMGAYGWGAKRT